MKNKIFKPQNSTKRTSNNVALCFFVAMMIGCAQPSVKDTNTPAPIASTDVVKANPQEVSLVRGESGELLVPIQITSGYHLNANPPSYPYLKATELELQPVEGISVEFITYPDPLTRKFAFAENPLAVYEGETTLKARLKADKAAAPGKHNLSAKLRVQACDDQVCYAPGALDLKVAVNIK